MKIYPLAILALLSSCHRTHHQGTIGLLVTDAPVPFESVRTATMDIDRITIDCGPDSPRIPLVLYEGDPISIDVGALRNGSLRYLAHHDVSPFKYKRIHVHFSGAHLVLANGREFRTDDGTLRMPHGIADGVEVTLETPVTVTENEWSRLLLDIDLPRSFVPHGGSTLEQATSVRLDPLLHAVRPGKTGEIRGLVSSLDESGSPVAVGDATVYFLPAGTESLEMAIGTTGTDADGSFAKLGLLPGSYDVVAVKGGQAMTYAGCVVTADTYSMLEIQLP